MGEHPFASLVNSDPLNYQFDAIDFVLKRFGVFADTGIHSNGVGLFMAMGSGKTYICIVVLGILFILGFVKRVLVLAPKTALDVWEEEFEKFTKFSYSLTIASGSNVKKDKPLPFPDSEGLNVLCVNYSMATIREVELTAWCPDLIIADEGHMIKNFFSQRTQAVCRMGMKVRYKLLLTGTPITNNEKDIFSEFFFLNPSIFGVYYRDFLDRYFYYPQYYSTDRIFNKNRATEFMAKVRSISFCASREECLRLPDSIDLIYEVKLESNVLNLYDDISTKYNDDPYICLIRWSELTGGFWVDEDGWDLVSLAKINALQNVIGNPRFAGRKMVILARFTKEIQLIQAMLKMNGFEFATITGKTQDRNAQICKFQEDPNCRFLVGEIKSTALSLNLQCASVMVFYSLGWEMDYFEQAKARIRRAGQTETCYYIYLLCSGTIDVEIYRALKRKVNVLNWLMGNNSGRKPKEKKQAGA